MREREMNGERTPATTDDGLVTAWHPPNGVLILSHVATMSANAVSKLDVDLLIAGAGPAGMTAALVASLEGLDVILCEKSDQVGGTGSTSAGTLWIPGNSQSRAAGFDDSEEKADLYLSALIGQETNRELRSAFLRTGPAAIDLRAIRRAIPSLRQASRLSQQHAGCGCRGPRDRAGAV
jgi:glycine/D-amino acid oxidase-like deaminating enzyme